MGRSFRVYFKIILSRKDDVGCELILLFCPTQALPLTRFQAVVALAVGRLADKSVLVCKNAIQLLASFLANNPFSCKVSTLGPSKKKKKGLNGNRDGIM